MTDPDKLYIPASITANLKRLNVQLLYHNLYRLLRPARKRYNMTVNEILVLNGIYIYTVVCKTEFTQNGIYEFVTYYNRPLLRHYFDRLLKKEYISYHRVANKHIFYRVTDKGYEVMNNMFIEFEEIQQKFNQKWNINI